MRRGAVWGAGAVVLLIVAWPGYASPAVPTVSVLSAPSPFAPTDCGERIENNVISRDDTPFEPQIAVNPRNPNNIVATYIQDAFLSNVVRVSFDDGVSWRTVTVPGLTICTGGLGQAAGDPSLAFNDDGTVLYLVSLTGALLAPHSPAGVVVNRSVDGGLTWSRPTQIMRVDGATHDMNFITTDPHNPDTAYVSVPIAIPLEEVYAGLLFSKTTDGGSRWTVPSVVSLPLPENGPGNAHIAVLRNGALVDLYENIHRRNFLPGPLDPHVDDKILASRSTDGGASWSKPVTVGSYPGGDPQVFDRMATYMTATGSQSGSVFVAWPIVSGATSVIAVARSDDGLSWRRLADASPTGAACSLATVAAGADGSIGVTYYQVEANSPSLADTWLARSNDGGATWTRTRLAGPFNPTATKGLAGGAITDYEGLAWDGTGGFVAAFEMTAPRAVHGPSDIFFARVSSRP